MEIVLSSFGGKIIYISREVDVIEQDVITHLIDVERQASDLLLEAQTEADSRVMAAKEQAEKDYRVAYEKIINDLDASLAAEQKKIEQARNDQNTEYNSRLEAVKKDYSMFSALLDSVFSDDA